MYAYIRCYVSKHWIRVHTHTLTQTNTLMYVYITHKHLNVCVCVCARARVYQVLRLKSTGVSMWQDLLFLGDIDVVDTWKDIKEVLAKQIALAASNESSSTSTPSTSADAVQQGESRDVNDMTGFELSDAEGDPSGSFFFSCFFLTLDGAEGLWS